MTDTESKTPVVPAATREQVIRFLEASGRKFFVMKNADLVRSLPEPFASSMDTVQQLVSCYRDHRSQLSTGFVEDMRVEDPTTGRTKTLTISIRKTEVLEPEEWDELIAWAKEQRAIAVEARTHERTNVRAID